MFSISKHVSTHLGDNNVFIYAKIFKTCSSKYVHAIFGEQPFEKKECNAICEVINHLQDNPLGLSYPNGWNLGTLFHLY